MRLKYSGYKLFCRYVWIILCRDYKACIPFSRVCSLMGDVYDVFERSTKMFFKGLAEQYNDTPEYILEGERQAQRHITKDQEDYQTWPAWMTDSTTRNVEFMTSDHATKVWFDKIKK